MSPHRRISMLLVASAMALADVDSVYADEQHQCFFESIQATFTAGTSTYRVEAACREYSPGEVFQESGYTNMRWSSQGTYDPRTRLLEKTYR